MKVSFYLFVFCLHHFVDNDCPSIGLKSSVHTHLNYLVMVTPPFTPTASAASATVRNLAARLTNPAESEVTKVTLLDLENKLVAYSGTFAEGVREVVSQWGKVYVLGNDGKVPDVLLLFIFGADVLTYLAFLLGREAQFSEARDVVPQIPLRYGTQHSAHPTHGGIQRRRHPPPIRRPPVRQR